jgi:hypothetical protein
MKSSVPSITKIDKDAKECVQKSVFFSEAAEKCRLEKKRKMIGGEDILYTTSYAGSRTLKIHLAKLRAVSGEVFSLRGGTHDHELLFLHHGHQPTSALPHFHSSPYPLPILSVHSYRTRLFLGCVRFVFLSWF